MEPVLRDNYWSDLKAREAFKAFILKIHNLDFTEWETRGYWDPAYTPFSYFKNDEIISSVCLYMLDGVINGLDIKLAQISGVGTSQEYRRQGLSRALTDRALTWAKNQHEGIFLFADEEAIPFYKHCGFAPIQEILEYCSIEPVVRSSGIVQLDPAKQYDLDRMVSYAGKRTALSDKFSVHNIKLLMFHALYTLRDKIYEIPDLDCVIFFDRDEEVVNIYDILGATIPPFKKIYPYISKDSDRRIDFHFHTDKLGITDIQSRPLVGNNPFTKGSFPLSKPVFPFTSRA